MRDIQIRPATDADFESMWSIFSAHVAAGETYTFTMATSREAGYTYWLGPGVCSYVAAMGGTRVLGMYRLVPNQVGRGHHVGNASYMVSPSAQGAGIGRMMGEHSLQEARRQGYLAM